VPSSRSNTFDSLTDALKAVRELLKVQLAMEEMYSNNAAGVWEDVSDFMDDTVQQTMLRILKAVVFKIRSLVVAATPDFSVLPVGAGVLGGFPVISKLFGEAARSGSRMISTFNSEIKSMETRDQSRFVSGDKLLGNVARMGALAGTINFLGDVIDAADSIDVDDESLIEHIDDITGRYSENARVNDAAIASGAATSDQVTEMMGSVSHSEGLMATAEAEGTSAITFYGPDGKPLTPSGKVNIDISQLPGFDPHQERMWEDLIAIHEQGPGYGYKDEYTAQFWSRHGFSNAEDAVEEFGESVLGPHEMDISDIGSLGESSGSEQNTQVDSPESIIDKLEGDLGELVGDIVSASDSEVVSEQLADELESAESQAQEARQNTKVIRIIESLNT